MYTYTQSRVVKKVRVEASSRRVDEIVAHVSQGWMPVNGVTLKIMQQRLKNGEYDHDRNLLIHDIKSDQGLFGYIVKSLNNIGADLGGLTNPIKVLSHIDLEKLSGIINMSERSLSSFRITQANKAQQASLKYSIIACSSAESVAKAADEGVDADLAFCAAFMRQIGINLIAWNYPETHARIYSSMRDGEEIDEAYERILGITPRALGARLAREWRLGSDLRVISGIAPGTMSSDQELSLGKEVGKLLGICEIGEAFARVNDCEHYPRAKMEWAAVSNKITELLGPQGVELIVENITESARAYATIFKNVLSSEYAPLLEEETQIGCSADRLFQLNPSVKRCPTDLIEWYRQVYAMMRESGISNEALKSLIEDLVPRSGFANGCVYLLDHSATRLWPALRIGSRPLDKYHKHDYRESHALVQAIYSSIPFVQYGLSPLNEKVSYIAGALGERECIGVLYLELNEDFYEGSTHDPVLYFKTLCRALNHCLDR